MLRRLTPSSLELEQAADALIQSVSKEDRQRWLADKLTKAVFVILEAARMKAFESIEAGPEPHKLPVFMAEAALADYLMDELADYMSGADEDEQDEH